MAKGLDVGRINILPSQQDGSDAVDSLRIKNCTATDTTIQEHANEFIEDKVLR